MKSRFFALIIAGMVSGTIPDAAYPQDMTKTQLQRMYSGYLQSEGFSPAVDSDGDVSFKYQGGNYYISVDEKDQAFFQLVLPNIWKIESHSERNDAALAASLLSERKKIVKVYVTDWDNVMISAELLLPSPSDFSLFFYRLLELIANTQREFYEKMR
ncbi:MAG: hypothetical protein LBG87_08175 [Spirochaetaceae bacterium]|jgi:hypothetical protein|nr:hypothetical protein [Spirochaetaceae bacterium]